MGWGQLIVEIGGELLANNQQNHASDAAQHGAQRGLDWTQHVYDDSETRFAPYLAAGENGLAGLNRLAGGDYSGFENSPDYRYARDEAQYGIDHRSAAMGQYYDPGVNIELARQLNGIASQNLGNYRNSLQYLATLGQNSATNLGSIGNGLAGNMMQGYNNLANAQGMGYGANAGLATGLAGAFNNWYQGQNQPLTDSSYGNGGYNGGGTGWGDTWGNGSNYNTDVGWVDYNNPGGG